MTFARLSAYTGAMCGVLGLLSIPTQAQLRIVDYNTAGGPRAGLATVLEAIGNDVVNGFSKPIDVLTLQEQSSSATTTQAIVDVLNGIYGALGGHPEIITEWCNSLANKCQPDCMPGCGDEYPRFDSPLGVFTVPHFGRHHVGSGECNP